MSLEKDMRGKVKKMKIDDYIKFTTEFSKFIGRRKKIKKIKGRFVV